MIDKIAGAKSVVYTRDGTPLLFSPDHKQGVVMPSLYTLYSSQNQMLPLRVVVKDGVQSFIFRGADLMWPGVAEVTNIF